MNDQILRAIKTLYQKGDVVEVRALKPPEIPYVGRYLYGRELVEMLTEIDATMDYDLYICLNPTLLPPTPLQRYQFGTKERDVPFRRWFLLDGDPIRTNKIATDEEWKAAYNAMSRAKDWLLTMGWTQESVVKASSGNGVHLLVRCDLPNDPESKALIRHAQNAVSQQFSTDKVIIECFPDADRITRCYGSLNRKGKETETLKHRRSGLLE